MKKILIAILASLLAAPPGSWAASTGSLSGRVITAADRPAATAVWVAPSNAAATPVQASVAADGSFTVNDIPAGTVELAVETSEGLYVVHTPVAIAPGTTRTLQLALGGRQDTSQPPPADDTKKKKKTPGGVWANPLYATLIVVGSAIVVGVLVNELTKPNDKPASPSTTTQ
jgi:hypothetical protein